IPGVVFLDVAAQGALKYNIIPLLPYDRYARKTVGYLYAIEHGAQYIYDTDDDITLLDGLRGFQIDAAVSRGLMPATDNLTFNPYPHFGQESLWPRGYPLEELEHNTAHDYQLCSVPQASIRQGLANGEPDVDAILRLTLGGGRGAPPRGMAYRFSTSHKNRTRRLLMLPACHPSKQIEFTKTPD
ncbi:hypothetical protein NP493_8279g00004, partial [Ridgeia piscesae]